MGKTFDWVREFSERIGILFYPLRFLRVLSQQADLFLNGLRDGLKPDDFAACRHVVSCRFNPGNYCRHRRKQSFDNLNRIDAFLELGWEALHERSEDGFGSFNAASHARLIGERGQPFGTARIATIDGYVIVQHILLRGRR